MQDEIYKPEGSLSLNEVTMETQIRLGIQGVPGCGKTWAALTFPNPIVANFDRGLIVHKGRSDVIDVPFWKGEYCDTLWNRSGQEAPPNRRDAFLFFLSHQAKQLTSKQSLVVDSNRQLEVSYHTEYRLNPAITRKGKENEFEEWTQKITYFQKVGDLYKELSCSVVYLIHEIDDVDDEGKPNGKVRAALMGQAGRTISSDFTDYYRQIVIAKPLTNERKEALLSSQFNPRGELDNWINSTSPEHESIYLWQTQQDEQCKGIKTSLLNAPKYVPANYGTFLKYKRTNITKE